MGTIELTREAHNISLTKTQNNGTVCTVLPDKNVCGEYSNTHRPIWTWEKTNGPNQNFENFKA